MPISKGYYLKARIIVNKPIAHAPPHIREVWDYLLREANYKDNLYSGHLIKRGQLFRTYKDIREALHWKVGWRKMMYSENHMKASMRYLRNALMITTRKALGGVMITVINYDTYQSPANYESTIENTNESTSCAPTNTPSCPDNNKKVKESKKKEPKKKIKSFVENSDEFRLANFLHQHILRHKPDFIKPNLPSWARHADFILRIDKRPLEAVQAVIKWATNDPFWQSNILSMAKLRKQFDALESRMKLKPRNGEKKERTLTEIADAMVYDKNGGFELHYKDKQ